MTETPNDNPPAVRRFGPTHSINGVHLGVEVDQPGGGSVYRNGLLPPGVSDQAIETAYELLVAQALDDGTPAERACNCVDAPDCVHRSVPEQRLAEAIFGTRPDPAPAAASDPDRACAHLDFEANVTVNRVGEEDPDSGGRPTAYVADITVHCAAAGCAERFIWQGVPAGLSYTAPAVSVDGAELRAPMRPESEPWFGRGRRLRGFTVTAHEPQGDDT